MPPTGRGPQRSSRAGEPVPAVGAFFRPVDRASARPALVASARRGTTTPHTVRCWNNRISKGGFRDSIEPRGHSRCADGRWHAASHISMGPAALV